MHRSAGRIQSVVQTLAVTDHFNVTTAHYELWGAQFQLQHYFGEIP